MGYEYKNEKLYNIVYALLVGEGNSKERLRSQSVHIGLILGEGFPPECQERANELQLILNAKPKIEIGEFYKSSIDHTISKMNNKQASQVIAKIYALQQSIYQ